MYISYLKAIVKYLLHYSLRSNILTSFYINMKLSKFIISSKVLKPGKSLIVVSNSLQSHGL